MKRNVLYLVIGVLVVVTVVIGYQLYQERQKTTGIEINVGKTRHFHREEVGAVLRGRSLRQGDT